MRQSTMVNEIVHTLNQTLQDLSGSAAIYGIAHTVSRTQGSETDILPGIIDRDGEVTYVGIDDVYTLIAYHKLNTVNSTQLNTGYGDAAGNVVNTFGMALIVYWDRKRFNAFPHEMIMLLQARMPQMIVGVPNVRTARVRIGSANLNSVQVYNQEYSVATPTLPPSSNLIQINYTIELVLNPDCLPVCADCP